MASRARTETVWRRIATPQDTFGCDPAGFAWPRQARRRQISRRETLRPIPRAVPEDRSWLGISSGRRSPGFIGKRIGIVLPFISHVR
ncbi:hypothetical protein ABI_22870 [Asticcacaulis biprosthecium C19]|uniref:Uncharacterized protein n=1 Tax=Asticcacaulis biprosthecium C19 TaxID=715226 RepID=F4QNG7_9CAUL|nr:hypothetical protein ABI_22870 [Asticcacaulis biprosthecium C19]